MATVKAITCAELRAELVPGQVGASTLAKVLQWLDEGNPPSLLVELLDPIGADDLFKPILEGQGQGQGQGQGLQEQQRQSARLHPLAHGHLARPNLEATDPSLRSRLLPLQSGDAGEKTLSPLEVASVRRANPELTAIRHEGESAGGARHGRGDGEAGQAALRLRRHEGDFTANAPAQHHCSKHSR